VSKINQDELEYKLTGNGENTIIFLNGFRMSHDTWGQVSTDISVEHSVLVFNRRGIGKSSKAQREQSGETVIKEIHSLIVNLNITPPFLLVAHTLGAIFANLYARTYPKDVLGLVFIDGTHPSEIAQHRKNKSSFFIKMINDTLKSIEKLFDQYKYSEDECINKTVLQIQNADPFPNVPVAIVSGAKKIPFVSAEEFSVHQGYQLALLKLSAKSTHYQCHQSSHFPQITEPDKVVSVIKSTLIQANTTSILPL
jgi:pimeloyl-ACP methyl ester carboxylesterase